jgi:hypothetical protein
MTIFTSDEWTYIVLRFGKLRIGWYHGIGNYSAWFVR